MERSDWKQNSKMIQGAAIAAALHMTLIETTMADIADPVVLSPDNGTVFNTDTIVVRGKVEPGYGIALEVANYSAYFITETGERKHYWEYDVPVDQEGNWFYRLQPAGEYDIDVWLYTLSPDGMEESTA